MLQDRLESPRWVAGQPALVAFAPLLLALGLVGPGCADSRGDPPAPSAPDWYVLGPEQGGLPFHNGGTCLSCHEIRGSTSNLQLINTTVPTPNSGDRAVVFTSFTGKNSFADGDDVYDGLCEVCHTQTNHHRNDGSDGTSHFDGEDCRNCHTHDDEFSPSGPAGPGHDTHASQSVRGPSPLGCFDCHGNSFTTFKDGKTLAETNVCDNCHSPNGAYDGVGDPVIGAKANWANGAYDGNYLRAGKEQWCAGCHDDAPANSKIDGSGVAAPPVIGNEKAVTDYGIGYGYYKTGHGLPGGSLYPATLSSGAGLSCTACHSVAKDHIDGVHRSYAPDSAYLTYHPTSASYQDGYRLRDVATGYDGIYPMHVPRTGHATPPGFRADWEFALCFTCHDKDKLFNPGDPATGSGAGTAFATKVGEIWQSMHDLHTGGLNGPGGASAPQWDSDFDGVADSRMTCVSCHNVHGSPSPAMVRHGELISTPGTTDKVSALGFEYTPAGTHPLRADSTGGKTRFIGPGPGSVAKNGVCAMCHNDSVTWTRTPPSTPGPRMGNLSPLAGALNISSSTKLTFKLTEHITGIDWSSFSIQLTGSAGYAQTWTDESVGVVSKTGTAAAYEVTVEPDVYFGAEETITVVVSVKDLASPPNTLVHQAWTFTTKAATAAEVELHPSGLASNPGVWSVNGGDWADVLDTNDGNTSRIDRCCAAPGQIVYLAMDDPNGLAGATINNVTVQVRARYQEGPWPGAVPKVGSLTVGYKTGAATVWSSTFTTDLSGSYNLLTTAAWTLDSDGGPLELSDIDALQVAIRRGTAGSYQLRVTEVLVTVGYTPAP